MPFGHTKQPVKAVISDLTATCVLNTTYQNTTGRPKLVLVSIRCDRKAAADAAYATAYVEDATPPTVSMGEAGFPIGQLLIEGLDFLVFAVPNSQYYRVEDTKGPGASTVAIRRWIEIEL